MSKVSQIFDNIEQDIDEFVDCFMEESLARIKAKTPVRTGTLRDGWERNGNEIYNNVEYASYIEFGTRYIEPVGMVRTTVMEADSIAKQCADKVRND